MNEDDKRDRALTLAQAAEGGFGVPSTKAIIDRARLYYDFLTGTKDAAVIDAARTFAETVLSADEPNRYPFANGAISSGA